MNKHILYLNYILYIYRSDKFIWRKLRANILASVFFWAWGEKIFHKTPTNWVVSRFLPTKTPGVIAPAASSTYRNSFSVLLLWGLFWSRRTPLRKLYFLAYQSYLLISLSFSSLDWIALRIKEAILSQLSGNLSIVAIMLSFDNSVPTCAASSLLSCSWARHANVVCSPLSSSSLHNRQLLLGLCPLAARYTPKHPWPLSPCVRRYSIEPCSSSSVLVSVGTHPVRPIFLSSQELATWWNPWKYVCCVSWQYPPSTDYAQIHLALHCAHMFIH